MQKKDAILSTAYMETEMQVKCFPSITVLWNSVYFD